MYSTVTERIRRSPEARRRCIAAVGPSPLPASSNRRASVASIRPFSTTKPVPRGRKRWLPVALYMPTSNTEGLKRAMVLGKSALAEAAHTHIAS